MTAPNDRNASPTVADAEELLRSNLHDVFSERDPERRWAAIERTYTEDVRFIDPEAESVGRQALNERAQKLVEAAAGLVLEEDGPAYVLNDTAAARAWRLGPPDQPVARGLDVFTIRDGRVSVVQTLLTSETSA